MRPIAVIVLVILLTILAFLGFYSGASFLIDPSGGTHGVNTSMLEGTPVDDFTLVGLFFVIAYGILPVMAIYGLWTLPSWRLTDPIDRWVGKNWAWSATVAIGVILMVWILVEVAYIGSPEGFPRFLQVMMGLLGAVLITLAMLPSTRTYARLAD
jgi:hypothetical protein